MNISESKRDRFALGNLSNTGSGFIPTSAISSKTLDSNVLKRSKTVFADASSSRKFPLKPFVLNIAKNDPENCPISPLVTNNYYDENCFTYTSTSLRDKDLSEKPKSILKRKDLSKSPLTMMPLSQNALNNKRQLRPSYEMDCAVEEKFGHSYFVQDEEFMQDDLKKKVKTATDMISFPQTFQTFDCKFGVGLEQENDDLINIYEDFGIDLDFCNGNVINITLFEDK